MNNSDKKITELPIAKELQPNDVLAIVQGGLTSQVTLQELRDQLHQQMQPQISIPQARIKVARDFDLLANGHDQVLASWEGSDRNFLDYNPEFWLYRYRKADIAKRKGPIRKKKKIIEGEISQKDLQYIYRNKRFVHPSHMHGHGEGKEGQSNFYKGEQIVMVDGEKLLLPARLTEWPVDGRPYQETPLTIEPWKYFKTRDQKGWETLSPKNFPTEFQPIPKGAHSSHARMVVFKVRIAIDNPQKDLRQPKLFGPFSETFIFFPHRVGGLFVSLKCYLGEEASPMLRKRTKGIQVMT